MPQKKIYAIGADPKSFIKKFCLDRSLPEAPAPEVVDPTTLKPCESQIKKPGSMLRWTISDNFHIFYQDSQPGCWQSYCVH